MLQPPRLRLQELIFSLSSAVDLVSSAVADHHMHVAYIAGALCGEAGFVRHDQITAILAGALHDIGALSLHERLEALNFEMDRPHDHAELGYRLLHEFKPLATAAELIRFHHVPWDDGKGRIFHDEEVPHLSHVLHLADRIAVLLKSEEDPLSRGTKILPMIREKAGRLFDPKLVAAFERLSDKEYFWLEAVSPVRSTLLLFHSGDEYMDLDAAGLSEFARLFARIIDFRSRHTATHSSAVAAVGAEIARLVGFSEREIEDIRVAGYLHDLGKLSVPKEILDKKAALTPGEYNIVKRHTYYTHRLLGRIESLSNIRPWAAFHHERLDGSGYPFHITAHDLPLGGRIIAVSDVYCALMEDRPYRNGISMAAALDQLAEMARDGLVDEFLIDRVRSHIHLVEEIRLAAHDEALEEYSRIV